MFTGDINARYVIDDVRQPFHDHFCTVHTFTIINVDENKSTQQQHQQQIDGRSTQQWPSQFSQWDVEPWGGNDDNALVTTVATPVSQLLVGQTVIVSSDSVLS